MFYLLISVLIFFIFFLKCYNNLREDIREEDDIYEIIE